MLVNPYLVKKLYDRKDGMDEDLEEITNISMYKEKCLIQIKKHYLIYDLVTGLNLNYFELSDENYKLDIEVNIMLMGESKYILD